MKTEMCWGLKIPGPLTFFACLRSFACWSELSKTTCFPVFAVALSRRPSGVPDGRGVVSGGFGWGVAIH